VQAAQVGMLLRVFIGEADREGVHGLDGVIVEAARAAGLAGATVLHGPLGFGASRRTNSDFIVDAPGNLPVVVEVVDTEQRVNAFLPTLDRLIGSGLVTLEEVRMLRCGWRTGEAAARIDGGPAVAP
jgi:uncharacterized protein